MPTWPSPEAFARDLDRLERELATTAARAITKAQAEEAQKIAYEVAAADLGGDRRFSGWAPELELRVRSMKGVGHGLFPTRSSAGPWTVAEFGRNTTSGPMVRAGRDGRARRTRAGNVSIVRRRRRWNGVTAGKSTASTAVARIEKEVPKIAEKRVSRVLRRRFDVM